MREQPAPLAAPWEQTRARIAAMSAEALLKWQKQLLDTVAMSKAQAERCQLGHLPGWHGTTGLPLLALIEARLNQPFPAS